MKLLSKLKYGFYIPTFIFFSLFNISGESMEPNLSNDDVIFVDHIAYFFSAPARGDVVLFYGTDEPDKIFIKRIIGLPEETVKLDDGDIYITFDERTFQYHEDYVTYPDNSEKTYEVPEDKYFVLGDNRRNSYDSRTWSDPFVPGDNIIGKYDSIFIHASTHKTVFNNL